jgi:hypothetical protein
MRMHIGNSPMHLGFTVYLADRGHGDASIIVTPETRVYNAGDSVPPTAVMLKEEVQRLVDDLWQMGFRPTKGDWASEFLNSGTKHLDDMRAIVSQTLGVKLP